MICGSALTCHETLISRQGNASSKNVRSNSPPKWVGLKTCRKVEPVTKQTRCKEKLKIFFGDCDYPKSFRFVTEHSVFLKWFHNFSSQNLVLQVSWKLTRLKAIEISYAKKIYIPKKIEKLNKKHRFHLKRRNTLRAFATSYCSIGTCLFCYGFSEEIEGLLRRFLVQTTGN